MWPRRSYSRRGLFFFILKCKFGHQTHKRVQRLILGLIVRHLLSSEPKSFQINLERFRNPQPILLKYLEFPLLD